LEKTSTREEQQQTPEKKKLLQAEEGKNKPDINKRRRKGE